MTITASLSKLFLFLVLMLDEIVWMKSLTIRLSLLILECNTIVI